MYFLFPKQMSEFAPNDQSQTLAREEAFGCATCEASGSCDRTDKSHLEFNGINIDDDGLAFLKDYQQNKAARDAEILAGKTILPSFSFESPAESDTGNMKTVIKFETVSLPDDVSLFAHSDKREAVPSEGRKAVHIEGPKGEPQASPVLETVSSPLIALQQKATEAMKPVAVSALTPEATPSPMERSMDIPVNKEVAHIESFEELEDLELPPTFNQDPDKLDQVIVIKSELKESHVETYSANLGFKLNSKGQMDLYFEGSDLGVLESWDEEKVSGPGELTLQHMQGIVAQLMESGHALAVVTTPEGKEFTYLYELEGSGVKVREFVERKPEPLQKEGRIVPEKPKRPDNPDKQPIFGKPANDEYRVSANHELASKPEPLNIASESFIKENTISRITNGIYIEEAGTVAQGSFIESLPATNIAQGIELGIERTMSVSETPFKAERGTAEEISSIFSHEKAASLAQEASLQASPTLEHGTQDVVETAEQDTDEISIFNPTTTKKSEGLKVLEMPSTSSLEPTLESSTIAGRAEALHEGISLHTVTAPEQRVSEVQPAHQATEDLETDDSSVLEGPVSESLEPAMIQKAINPERTHEQDQDVIVATPTEKVVAGLKAEAPSNIETTYTGPEFKAVRIEDFKPAQKAYQKAGKEVIRAAKPEVSRQVFGQQEIRKAESQLNQRIREAADESASQVLSALRAFKNLENIPRRESKAPNSPPPASLNDQLLAAVVRETPGYLDGAEVEALAA